MLKASVARPIEVFCTEPEMHGLITEPPMPMNRMASSTGTSTPAPAVISGSTLSASGWPPNQTG
jgi:hypothetical protein